MPTQQDRHIQYVNMQKAWERCRDAKLGEDAIKARGETYLPKLGGQTDAMYDAYKTRGRFHNAFGKTIKGFTGLAVRKDPIIDAPDAMEDLLNNVDRQGSDVAAYFKQILEEILEVGRAGTLIDFPNTEEDPGEEERPYWVLYKTEDILDWQYKNGKLVYVLVREEREEKRGFKTGLELEYNYRELILDEDNNGVYTQKVYKDDQNVPFIVVTPTVGGETLDFIPFVIHQTDYDTDVDQPPLLDLVNLCLSHYRLKADHMHALHYVALPTPWITGIDGSPPEEGAVDTVPRAIGPEAIWYITDSDAKVGMLEFTGAGVEAIKSELDQMEDQMAILGSRILLPEVSENTATASKLRSISETSDLASIVVIVEKQLTWMLAFTTQWAGQGEEAEIQIDKQFLPADMDPAMVSSLVSAWQNSAFDYETLVNNFKRAEIIDAETTAEDLIAATEKEEMDRMEKSAESIRMITEASGNEDQENEDS